MTLAKAERIFVTHCGFPFLLQKEVTIVPVEGIDEATSVDVVAANHDKTELGVESDYGDGGHSRTSGMAVNCLILLLQQEVSS